MSAKNHSYDQGLQKRGAVKPSCSGARLFEGPVEMNL